MHYVFAAFSVSLKQDNLLLGKSCSVLSCVTLVYSFPNKQKQGCPSRWRWHVRARISDVYRGCSLSLLEKSILIVKPLRCRSLTPDHQDWTARGDRAMVTFSFVSLEWTQSSGLWSLVLVCPLSRALPSHTCCCLLLTVSLWSCSLFSAAVRAMIVESCRFAAIWCFLQ